MKTDSHDQECLFVVHTVLFLNVDIIKELLETSSRFNSVSLML